MLLYNIKRITTTLKKANVVFAHICDIFVNISRLINDFTKAFFTIFIMIEFP